MDSRLHLRLRRDVIVDPERHGVEQNWPTWEGRLLRPIECGILSRDLHYVCPRGVEFPRGRMSITPFEDGLGPL